MWGRSLWLAIALVPMFCGVQAEVSPWRRQLPIQSCVPVDKLLSVVNAECLPVVGNKSVVVQSNLTSMDNFVKKTFRSLIYVQNAECRQGIVNFACGMFYPACTPDYPAICPCDEVQHRLTSHKEGPCKGDAFGLSLADYAMTLLSNFTRDHRPCGTLLNSSEGVCNHPTGASGAIECPDEMVKPDVPGARDVYINADEGPDWPPGQGQAWSGGTIEVCKLPCYPSLFSEDEARASVVMVTTLAWISTVCSALLVVIFHMCGSGKDLHGWPERLQVYFTTCVFFLSLSLTFASFLGYSNSMWCENQALCTLQALLLEFFGLALAMWWLIICFNLFLSVVVYRQDGSTNEDIQAATEWWEKFYHGVAWGVPAFFTIILAYNSKLGYPVYGNPSYCWIADENSSLWEFSFYFVEILVIVVIGMFFFGASLLKLRRLTAHQQWSIGKLLQKVATVVSFIFAFAFTFTFMGIYQITLTSQEDADRAAYDDYIQCAIKRWWLSSFPGASPAECVLKSHPDLVFMDIQSACFASLGIVTFLVFGSPHFPAIYRKCNEFLGRSRRTRGNSFRVKQGDDALLRDHDGHPADTDCSEERHDFSRPDSGLVV